MDIPFSPLKEISLAAGATVLRQADAASHAVTAGSPALEVMTDFAVVDAVRISANVPIDTALEQMKNAGVRLLFVMNPGDELLGVVTSRDIEGEKPMRMQRELGVTRAEVLVRDIMTPRDNLHVLLLEDVRRARVGDIVVTLKRMGRQHAMVVEKTGGRTSVRGLFSTSRIGRQLGVVLEVGELAKSFAEIEVALR
ncbi:MAG: CBS domain-containing protein [Gammaproteobacteria bacterium]|nr:CBS domain-containing protein [Gammaproteobacteria bacterium]